MASDATAPHTASTTSTPSPSGMLDGDDEDGVPQTWEDLPPPPASPPPRPPKQEEPTVPAKSPVKKAAKVGPQSRVSASPAEPPTSAPASASRQGSFVSSFPSAQKIQILAGLKTASPAQQYHEANKRNVSISSSTCQFRSSVMCSL